MAINATCAICGKLLTDPEINDTENEGICDSCLEDLGIFNPIDPTE